MSDGTFMPGMTGRKTELKFKLIGRPLTRSWASQTTAEYLEGFL